MPLLTSPVFPFRFMKILIVDDSSTANDSLMQAIRAGGHDVHHVDAKEGKAALNRLPEGGCDLILLTCSPDGAGRLDELCRQLRAYCDSAGQAERSLQTTDSVSEVALGDLVSLDDVERAHARRVMSRATSLEEAARILGIDAATLYRKRKRWAVTADGPRTDAH